MENPPNNKKTLIITAVVCAALIVPVALAAVGGWRMWKARQQADAEFAAALKSSLDRAADVVLPAPTLGADAVMLTCPMDEFEPELQRVIRLAKGLGGSASSWNDGQSVRVVASIPKNSVEIFRDAVTRGVFDIAGAGDRQPMTVVEVVLRPKS